VLAEPWAWTAATGWISCTSFSTGDLTGQCNTTTKQARFAYIYYNTFDPAPAYPNNVARHELGHVSGLRHWSGTTDSVLNVSEPWHQSLTSHDRSGINNIH